MRVLGYDFEGPVAEAAGSCSLSDFWDGQPRLVHVGLLVGGGVSVDQQREVLAEGKTDVGRGSRSAGVRVRENAAAEGDTVSVKLGHSALLIKS
jgi:hypothetical protein